MFISKITARGRSTIPVAIRKFLDLEPGDRIGFEIIDDKVMIRRLEPLDAVIVQLSAASFADGSGPEAEEAFRDL